MNVLGSAEQCLQSRPFSLFTPHMSDLGVLKKLGGHRARRADPSCPAGYPRLYRIMLSNTSWVKEKKEGGTFGMMVFVLASHCYADGDQLSWRLLNCLPLGTGE